MRSGAQRERINHLPSHWLHALELHLQDAKLAQLLMLRYARNPSTLYAKTHDIKALSGIS